jgi:hypothetical protein
MELLIQIALWSYLFFAVSNLYYDGKELVGMIKEDLAERDAAEKYNKYYRGRVTIGVVFLMLVTSLTPFINILFYLVNVLDAHIDFIKESFDKYFNFPLVRPRKPKDN